MKILFLGTPEFSAEILKRIPPKHTITAVVSQPDRAKDRKGNLLPTFIRRFCHVIEAARRYSPQF